MKVKKKSAETNDWRDRLLENLPEEFVRVSGKTFPSALALIEVAAYNRRMTVAEFVGRAALAVAVYDSEGTVSWWDATDKEPPMRDIRRDSLPARRMRGRGFGSWVIREMG